MATQWQTFPIKFAGGWRTDLGRLEQGITAPGSATQLKNFEPSVNGGYSKIKGFEKFSSTAVTGSGTVIGVIVVDETDVIARRDNDYYYSSGTTWTSKLTVATPGATRIDHDFFNFDGTERIVVVDGTDDPAYYNTTADTMAFDTSAPADVAGAHIVRVFKNHLFFGKGRMLTFTAPYNHLDFTPGNGAGQINVGADITGLIVFREQLIIFTENSILRLTGSSQGDFVLQPITNNTGCLCQYTVQEVGGDVMYLGPDGIRWLSATERNDDFGLERASRAIQDKILAIISLNCNYSSIVIRSKNQYRLFPYVESKPINLSEGFLATKFSGQDVSNIAWSRLMGMKVYSADSRQFRDREVILFANEVGYVYRMESTGGFDGEDINCLFETPYMPINDPRVRKTIYKHSLYVKTAGTFALDVGLRFDYNPSGSIQPAIIPLASATNTGIWGVSTWGDFIYSTALSDTFVNQTVGAGFVVALRYENTSTNPPFLLDMALLEFGINERR